MATDPNSSYCDFLITNLEEEEEGGGSEGILGNAVKDEETEPICVISAITRTAGELTLKETKEAEEKRTTTKRKRASKGKGKDDTVKTSDGSLAAQHCKKSDGKGWRCKRPAQLPNSLCSYHLTQIRAYTSNHRATDPSAAVTDNGNRQEEATGTDDSSLYYYYGGFGPSRGKQRGKTSTGVVKVKEDCSGKESGTMLDDGDGDNNAVAGDDEYDPDCFDEDDGDVNRSARQEHEEIDVGKEEEKKRVVKKRGRKPFKCRSLKSLL
ncbi:uncharacterized protein LOC109837534 isoform X2 [Asparagus officinalis]|uniref:uncharacterized protein LOC109837534 isoform X2 n=1 Tax=Asparagus officinalis TaxID=4686 RepID=UPI00098E1AFE|nr:uncharacterized protein LOC109837534 isoform X2 [Asparagus officinalis]